MERGRTTIINSSPLQLMGPFRGVPFRVHAFYMIANNGGKVSNLTVGPTQSIPFTLHHEQGAPLLYRISAAPWESLLRIIGRPRFVTAGARAMGVPTPNYTKPVLYRVGCRCGGYLTVLHRATKYYTRLSERHMASNEEHSALNKITPQEE